MNAEKKIPIVMLLSAFLLVVTVDVEAMPLVSFNFGTYTVSDGNVGGPVTVLITVTDSTANLNSLVSETVNITVTSDTDPSGISLTLNETGPNTGIFTNTKMIFTVEPYQFTTSDTVTLSQTNPTANLSSTSIDSFAITIKSDTDPSGLSITLDETSVNSGIFTNDISFTSNTSSGTSLEVSTGDVVSIPGGIGIFSNVLIVPNSDSSVGALEVSASDTITATYETVFDTAVMSTTGFGGGGGGGIRTSIIQVDSSNTGGGCSSDCMPPTLGVSSANYRFVEKGFSYNGHSIDVELFYSPYQLVTVNVGIPNTAILKVYENSGIESIRHVELGFGLGKNEIISKSNAVINYDIAFDGTTQTSVFDPEHALENVSVSSKSGKCRDSDIAERCMILFFEHTFRAPLDFNMIGTNVWDAKRNAWQNYYNHGIEILGDSLNPPKQIKALDRVGYQHTLTLFNQTIAIDEQEHIWHYTGSYWKIEDIAPLRDDPITKNGLDRNNNKWPMYVQGQILLAEKTLYEILHP